MTTAAPAPTSASSSYRQIFKVTALVGGAQVATILTGIVRTKVLATLLGPSGMGLAGLYQSATGVVTALTSLGMGSAGVRQIAGAAAADDAASIARTARAVRVASLVSGLAGMIIVAACARPLARLTFGDVRFASGLALVSLTLLFGGVSAGQMALLQGLRRVRDLASCQVVGALVGTVASIGLVWWLGERGVAPFLVAISGASVLSSWWYVRRLPIPPADTSFDRLWGEIRGLLAIGAAFLVSGLLAAGVAYATRVIIGHDLGLSAVGLYAATWTLSSLYVNTVLNAMGTDFFPRLTASASDHATLRRLVNEQTEMGVLIATPGVLFTLCLAPWVLRTFYSEAFVPAAEIVRWQALGVALRVISWPMGFIILAKGLARLYIGTETSAAVTQLVLLVLCLRGWGLEGAGIAFALLYLAYTGLMLYVSWRTVAFAWSRRATALIALSVLVTLATLALARTAPPAGLAGGLALSSAASVACVLTMNRLLGLDPLRSLRARWASLRSS